MSVRSQMQHAATRSLADLERKPASEKDSKQTSKHVINFEDEPAMPIARIQMGVRLTPEVYRELQAVKRRLGSSISMQDLIESGIRREIEARRKG